MRSVPYFAMTLVLLGSWVSSGADPADADSRVALEWFESLGYPDVTDLPYVRVATGLWTKAGNQTPENRFVEGFLIEDERDSFTIFICSVPDFARRFSAFSEPLQPLTNVRFLLKTDGPVHQRIEYKVLDFGKTASEVLERVRAQSAKSIDGLRWGKPLSHRARIFAFARACLQKGFSEIATQLFEVAAKIPDEQTGKVGSGVLRELLQRDMGNAILTETEANFGNPEISLSELLLDFENSDVRFPSHPRAVYARESAELLRMMIAEEAAHHPKPVAEMSPSEEIAECIYQLRNLGHVWWIMNSRYPIDGRLSGGEDVITPVHRLVDLAPASIPPLIEALDDRRFTRSMVPRHNFVFDEKDMRVGDVAQRILEHLSGRNFYARKTDDGRLVDGTTRQQAGAWWGEMQSKGEEQQLIEATTAGDEAACKAAWLLVEKYPGTA